MQHDFSLLVYPGGSREVFETRPYSKTTQLISRTGFVRLAITQGVPLIPAFGFGEKFLYDIPKVPAWFEKFQHWYLNVTGSVLHLFFGRFFSWIPFRKQVTLVVGLPIPVQQNSNPSQEYVEEITLNYQQAIINIFETFKERYGHQADEHVVFIDVEAKKQGRPKNHATVSAETSAAASPGSRKKAE